MTTERVMQFEMRRQRGIRVIYSLLLLAAASITGLSIYLRLFNVTYYRFSPFDPTIGWLGCLVSLIAILPVVFGHKYSTRTRVAAVAACIFVLAAFQLLILARAPFEDFSSGDFFINFRGAQELYGNLASPYSIDGSVSFPFPTYLIYWLSSLGGRLSISQSFSLFVISNLLLWFLVAILLWKHYKLSEHPPYTRLLFALLFLNSSAFDASTGNGQTTVLVSLALVVMLVSFGKTGRKWFLLGGAAAGTAVLIKPQAALILLGLLAILCYQVWNRRPFMHLATSIASALAIMSLLIGLSLWYPPGLKLGFYGEFFSRVLPALSDPAHFRVQNEFGLAKGNASPIALMVWALSKIIGSHPSGLSALVTIIAAGVFSIAVIRTARLPLSLAILPWLFAPLLLTKLTWSYSSIWVLPAYLFVISRQVRRGKNEMMVLLCVTSYAFLRVGINVLFLGSLGVLFVLLISSLAQEIQERYLPATSTGDLQEGLVQVA